MIPGMRSDNRRESGLVDIVRDFIEAHDRLRALFARYRDGELRFDEVRDLVRDDAGSPLFRLKERCHAQFREHRVIDEMRREALFDLAVGSLFHEAMKFRENFYQQEVYAPKVRKLRDEVKDAEDDELFEEFAKIQGGVAARLRETLSETQALLDHTREQLRVLLRGHAENGLATRYLLENPARVERVFPGGVEALLASIHGSHAEALVVAGLSYLSSARFADGGAAIDGAIAAGSAAPPLAALRCYARGMQAFLEARYGESLEALENWVDASRALEPEFAALAHSALARFERVSEAEADRVALRARADALVARLAPAAG